MVSLGVCAAVVAVAAAVVAVVAAARGHAQAGSSAASTPRTSGAWVDRHRIDPKMVEVTTCHIDRSDPDFPQIRSCRASERQRLSVGEPGGDVGAR